MTRCDKHRVRRNSLGGTPILRELIDCIYVYIYIYISILCILWLPYHVSFIIIDMFVPIFVKHVQVLGET